MSSLATRNKIAINPKRDESTKYKNNINERLKRKIKAANKKQKVNVVDTGNNNNNNSIQILIFRNNLSTTKIKVRV